MSSFLSSTGLSICLLGLPADSTKVASIIAPLALFIDNPNASSCLLNSLSSLLYFSFLLISF
ncbi:hypothetical protein [Francisella tularensis]|uniref:hypothetical protein n=1 Tax=Francisella tularensis TaxID=263 RepID=UPI001F1AF314|nr:hypothetical protein [Francisella tularensis]